MLDFQFVEFSMPRHARGVEAARILVRDCEGESLQWWGEDDLRHTVAEHGRHPALIRALAAYGKSLEREPSVGALECPALHARSSQYPYGDRVPKRIRMIKTVVPDLVVGAGIVLYENDLPQIALTGMTLQAWTHNSGAVAAVFPNGERLSLKKGDFEVIEWTELPR
jgi:hypothetical protein